MPKRNILIANSNPGECGEILVALRAIGQASLITSKAEYDPDKHECDLLLLYSNFTNDQGLDFIHETTLKNSVPILMIADIEHQECAAKALEAGAFNYLIKRSNYLEILSDIIEQAIIKFTEIKGLKKTIEVLNDRIAKTETQVNSGETSSIETSSTKPVAAVVDQTSREERKPLIDEIVSRFRKGEINIPTYPEINIKLARLIGEDAPLAKITELLKQDMSIVSNLIRLSNSAAFSGGKKIQTLDQAIYQLGLKQTQNVVEIISNRAFYTTKNMNYPNLLKAIWKHSIACAHAAAILGKKLRHTSPDELFTMGLLHDIGFLLLLQVISELENSKDYDVVIEKDSLLDFLKAHHGSFGRALLHRWKFPEQFASVAMCHEDLNATEQPSTEILIIHFANLLVESMGFGLEEPQEIELQNTQSAKSLGLVADAITEIKSKIEEEVNNISAVFLES